MDRSEMEAYLNTLEGVGRSLGAPEAAITQLARVRRRVLGLLRLRVPEEEDEEGAGGPLPVPDTVADIAGLYRRFVAAAEREGVDPVVVDYLWSREPRLRRMLAGEPERRVDEREPGTGPATLYGPEGAETVTVQDQSRQGFGVRMGRDPGIAEDSLVRLVVDDPIGYECFVVYRRPEDQGWRVGLDFPGYVARSDPESG